MNARFWIFYNEQWTKLTIRPGESLHISASGKTDEGWYSDLEIYRYDDGEVEREIYNRQRDCDGLTSEHYVCVALDTELRHNVREDEGTEVFFPNWKDIRDERRDYTAESMGY